MKLLKSKEKEEINVKKIKIGNNCTSPTFSRLINNLGTV